MCQIFSLTNTRLLYLDIQFVNANLAQEVLSDNRRPSVASNKLLEDIDDSDCQAVYWLLEE